jgi:hypothetical protein
MLRRRLAAAALVVLCGCGPDTTAPQPNSRVQNHRVTTPTADFSAGTARPPIAMTAIGDTLFATLVYTPASGNSFTIANRGGIVFPAYSICDPTVSTYGPTQWDAPCTAATSPIVIVARMWRSAGGHPRVDFAPKLRFVPTTQDRNMVKLFLSDRAASRPGLARLLTILYCPADDICTDESSTDPTLATQVDGNASIVWRRIKHFSGYNVAAGRSEPPGFAPTALDPTASY